MQIEESFDALHQVTEHDTIQSRDDILIQFSINPYIPVKDGQTWNESDPLREVSQKKNSRSINSCSTTSRSLHCWFHTLGVSTPDKLRRPKHTWNALNMIFSFLTHVKISLRNTLNVGKPNLASSRSWFGLFDCMSDGGSATAGSGGSSHMALVQNIINQSRLVL